MAKSGNLARILKKLARAVPLFGGLAGMLSSPVHASLSLERERLVLESRVAAAREALLVSSNPQTPDDGPSKSKIAQWFNWGNWNNWNNWPNWVNWGNWFNR